MLEVITRRRFVGALTATAIAAVLPGRPGSSAPGEGRLRIGVIGVANRGGANLNAVAGEEIVALCDVDAGYLRKAAARFPKARLYSDFRELLASDGLDAVVISTPDHTHAPAAAAALRRKLHVYCEKPLAHTVHEARTLARLARENGCATQMGTQIHAGANYRRVVEALRAGAIGPVREVHVFCDKTWSGGERSDATPATPADLAWDLWLGPAPERPYHPDYHPASWRRWWDFGGGTLADMGCHYLDLAHWALDLGGPTRIAAEGPGVHAETTPPHLVVRWDYPARDAGLLVAVRVTWYDGTARPEDLARLGLESWKNGLLFLGDEGHLIADYSHHEVGPEKRRAAFVRPAPSIADSIGHHAEWIAACKDGRPTTCHFGYSGSLTESVLLGNVAYRTGEVIDWDHTRLETRGSEAAQKLISRNYREGWRL